MMRVIRKIVCCLIWTILAFFGSAVLLGFTSGTFFYWQAAIGHQDKQLDTWIGLAWAVVPQLAAVAALVLGLLGILPGTGLRRSGPRSLQGG